MSNSNNLGKQVERLRKELEEIKAKDRRFHFVVVDATTTEQERVDAMLADGSMQKGDEYQVIQIPWAISQLKGAEHIPEGGGHDPFEEPPLPQPEISPAWQSAQDRDKRWADHIKKIEADGERYEGDKPKAKGWL